MSIFQCDKCGCKENTAMTRGYHGQYGMNLDYDQKRRPESMPALESYKEVLGLKPEEPFGYYCSYCCPVWFDGKGSYGVGPKPDGPRWHGEFERTFLRKGECFTDDQGNLRMKDTKEYTHEFLSRVRRTNLPGVQADQPPPDGGTPLHRRKDDR